MIHIRLASLSGRIVKDNWERTVKNKVNRLNKNSKKIF